jgi:hypothetical protein
LLACAAQRSCAAKAPHLGTAASRNSRAMSTPLSAGSAVISCFFMNASIDNMFTFCVAPSQPNRPLRFARRGSVKLRSVDV